MDLIQTGTMAIQAAQRQANIARAERQEPMDPPASVP